MITIHPIETIVSDPNVFNGEPIIAGTRIRVLHVVASYLYRGLSAEELAVNFGLELGQVHAVLAYYYQHKAELDQELRDDSARADAALAELKQQGKLINLE